MKNLMSIILKYTKYKSGAAKKMHRPHKALKRECGKMFDFAALFFGTECADRLFYARRALIKLYSAYFL